jgi:hypothetical protein
VVIANLDAQGGIGISEKDVQSVHRIRNPLIFMDFHFYIAVQHARFRCFSNKNPCSLFFKQLQTRASALSLFCPSSLSLSIGKRERYTVEP